MTTRSENIVAWRSRWKDALTWVHSTTEPARHPNLIVEPLCVAGEVAKPLLALRFKLSFNTVGNCTTFRKDQAEELDGQWVWLIDATDGKNNPLRAVGGSNA